MNPAAKLAMAVALIAGVASAGALADPASEASVERGRYLVAIAGCNDCHTPGYPERAGNVPEAEWLIGTPLGWHGPWGTTYAINLRLFASRMTEGQWLDRVRTVEPKPPMPWFNLRAMADADLIAIYRFIRNLGPAGAEAPKALPPTAPPPRPYVDFPGPPAGQR